MSQPQPKHEEYTEFVPQAEPRTPLAIASLPETAMTAEADPTMEIRSLIEQLQKTARDARGQAQTALQERDALALQFARAEQQIQVLRETELDLRSHFVEVTSIILERDTALTTSERCRRDLAEAERRLEGATRERDEAARQRDETSRKLAAFNRSNEEQARLIAETQKQALAIRQARDGAHAQIVELSKKMGQTEDRAADLEYQRELAEKATAQARTEAATYRRQFEATTLDRDATARQVEELTRELDEQRGKLLDLAEEKSAVLQADSEQAAALAEARAQLQSSAQERDAARARVEEQAAELEESRLQWQNSRDESAQALAAAREEFTALEARARETRHSARNLQQQIEGLKHQLAAQQSLMEESTARQAGIGRQLGELAEERDLAVNAREDAETQIGELLRDQENARAQAAETALALEAQIHALQGQVAAFENAGDHTRVRQEDLGLLQKRFEKQRLETIDLAARLQAAQREIRELSAGLAEARLQAKFATAASRATRDGATKSDFDNIVQEFSPIPGPPAASVVPVSSGTEETLSEKDARSAVAAMRQCFQSFIKKPEDLSLLNELYCHVYSLSERAQATGYLALHRLCASFSELTHRLYEIPDLLEPSTLRTLHQTIEFLGSLVRDGSYLLARDPAKAVIYAVDDDHGNCDAIRMAMETAFIRTVCVQEPAIALGELAGQSYDLIILDVSLPGMDGFELCEHIRELPLHTHTPVVFLTGYATVENRTQAADCGASDFIAKPFNLHELSVKAMTLILKNQLQLA